MSFLISNFPSSSGIRLTPTHFMPGPSPTVMVEHSVTFLSHILGLLISLLLPTFSIFSSLSFPLSLNTHFILSLWLLMCLSRVGMSWILDFFKAFFSFAFFLSQYYLCHGFPKSISKQKKKKCSLILLWISALAATIRNPHLRHDYRIQLPGLAEGPQRAMGLWELESIAWHVFLAVLSKAVASWWAVSLLRSTFTSFPSVLSI